MRAIVMFILTAASSSINAQTCTPKEFSQYQLEAKRPGGRITLAFAYCAAERTRDLYRLGSPRALQCDSEMQKAADAMKAAKEHSAYRFALAGCKGDMPPK